MNRIKNLLFIKINRFFRKRVSKVSIFLPVVFPNLSSWTTRDRHASQPYFWRITEMRYGPVFLLTLLLLAAAVVQRAVRATDEPSALSTEQEEALASSSESFEFQVCFSVPFDALVCCVSFASFLTGFQSLFNVQAEVNRLMDIIINSLYKNKDIFLREVRSF